MIVIWQGRGWLALAAVLLPLATCVGLIDWRTSAAFAASGVGFVFGGLGCIAYNRWARRSVEARNEEVRARAAAQKRLIRPGDLDPGQWHTLYFLPLWIWGWVYCGFGLFMLTGGIAGLIKGR